MEADLFRLIQSATGADAVQPFDLSDRGLLLADGVFTTMRVVSGRTILRERHLARLAGDAAALDIPVTEEALAALADATLPEATSGALRLTATRGPGARGLAGEGGGAPTLMARFTPMAFAFPAAPVSLMISPIRRNSSAPSARYKTLSYTDNIMALRGAVAAGYDDALLLGPDRQAACASAANIFARFGDRLVTPRVEDGAMPGILRGWLLEHASETGLTAAAAELSVDDLERADNIFLTNSLRIFQPVIRFGDKTFDPNLPPALLSLGRRLIGEVGDD